jgi:hypothetical protein
VRAFFLDAARIGQQDVGAAHQIDEGNVVEGFEEGDARDAAEAPAHHFAHVGIRMDRVDDLAVARAARRSTASQMLLEAGPETFAAVGGHRRSGA